MTKEQFLAARRTRAVELQLPNGGLYSDWSDAPDADNAWLVKQVTRPYTYEQVVAALRAPQPPSRCRGSGWIDHYDDSWPCGGCVRCGARAAKVDTRGVTDWRVADQMRKDAAAVETDRLLVAWLVGAWLQRMMAAEAHERFRQSLRGYEALAAVGRCIAGAAAVGSTIGEFVGWLGREYSEAAKGLWYRVVAERGSAKGKLGLEGECVWLGYSEGRYGRRGTLRVALKPDGAEKPIYVPESCVKLIKTPEAGIERERARLAQKEKPLFVGRVGKRGDEAVVVDGPHRGARGVVFWASYSLSYGSFMATATERGKSDRVGISVEGETEKRWCDARDVVGPAEAFSAHCRDTCGTPEQWERAAQMAEATMLRLEALEAPEAALWSVLAEALSKRVRL